MSDQIEISEHLKTKICDVAVDFVTKELEKQLKDSWHILIVEIALIAVVSIKISAYASSFESLKAFLYDQMYVILFFLMGYYIGKSQVWVRFINICKKENIK